MNNDSEHNEMIGVGGESVGQDGQAVRKNPKITVFLFRRSAKRPAISRSR